MRKEQLPLVSHVSGDSVESGTIGLTKKATDETVSQCAFVRVVNLQKYINEIIERDNYGFDHHEKIWEEIVDSICQ